jgi:ribosome-binding protein aMBF1 (putative translation factor)
MRCTICKKTSDEIPLYTGILESNMVNICNECAESEGIPIIKKPSESQLDKADKRYSVRERMERISGMRDTTEISDDQTLTQGNLAKLRIPPKKEQHEDILDNYYWTLNIARRRNKLSITQLAEKMQVDPEIIQGIEKGKIPENFEEIFIKLEAFLGIKLLKTHKKQTHFILPNKDETEEILKRVKEKMDSPKTEDEPTETKKERLEKLSKGEIDFSRREQLSDVTLNDLVEMKKARESQDSKRKSKAQEEAILGDDLELDIEEFN